MIPPKSRRWMYNRTNPGRRGFTTEFLDGLKYFINFVCQSPQYLREKTIRCPCLKCSSTKFQTIETVKLHLYRKGFKPNYWYWTDFGEEEPIIDNGSYVSKTTTAKEMEKKLSKGPIIDNGSYVSKTTTAKEMEKELSRGPIIDNGSYVSKTTTAKEMEKELSKGPIIDNGNYVSKTTTAKEMEKELSKGPIIDNGSYVSKTTTAKETEELSRGPIEFLMPHMEKDNTWSSTFTQKTYEEFRAKEVEYLIQCTKEGINPMSSKQLWTHYVGIYKDCACGSSANYSDFSSSHEDNRNHQMQQKIESLQHQLQQKEEFEKQLLLRVEKLERTQRKQQKEFESMMMFMINQSHQQINKDQEEEEDDGNEDL